MRAYVFLAPDRVTPVGDDPGWSAPPAGSPGAWVEREGGVRACRPGQLAHWLDAELWLAELAGELAERETCVVAARGRLLDRVDAWDAQLADAMTGECAWRARDQAVRVLRRHGAHAAAEALAEIESLAGVEAWARSGPVDALPGHGAFAADVAALACGRRPESWRHEPHPPPHRQQAHVTAANVAFCVAHGAGLEAADAASAGAYASGVRGERAWQAAWLRERLGIPAE